eukprot:UN21836
MSVKYTENFLEAFEKKVLAQKVRYSEYFNLISASFFHFFLSPSFFSKTSRNFSAHFTDMFEAFESCT